MSRSSCLSRRVLRAILPLLLAAPFDPPSSAAEIDGHASRQVSVEQRPDPSADARVTSLLDQQAGATGRIAEAQTRNVQGRLQQLHGDDSALCDRTVAAPARGPIAGDANGGAQSNASSPAAPSMTPAVPSMLPATPSVPPATPSTLPAATAAAPVSLPFAACQRVRFATAWTAGSLEVGASSAPVGGQGFGLHSKGVTFGADQRVSPELVLGVGLGLAHERTDSAGDGIWNGADAVSTMLYLGYRPSSALYIDALTGRGELQMRSARRLDERSSVAGARPGSQQFASVAAGYRLDVAGADVAPYTRVDALRSTLRSYSEADGADALQFERQSVPSLKLAIGIEGSARVPTRYGALRPRARFEARHELEGAGSAAVGYADASAGSAFAVEATAVPRNALSAGFGATLALRDSWSLGAGYAFDYASSARVSRVDLTLVRSLR